MAEDTSVNIPTSGLELSSLNGVDEDVMKFIVMQANGDQFEVLLYNGCTAHDLYEAVATELGFSARRLVLIAAGSDSSVPYSKSKSMLELVGIVRDMHVAVVGGVTLGDPSHLGRIQVVERLFPQYPLADILGCDGRDGMVKGVAKKAKLEMCSGVEITCSGAPGSHCGVIFSEASADAVESLPLWGKVMLRAVINSRDSALGIGVGTRDLALDVDPEYDENFFGLYHGGYSTNCCADGDRYYRDGKQWPEFVNLAIFLDIENRTMQCYQDTEKFGPLYTDLPEEDLWPVVTIVRTDSVTISIESCAF